MASYKGDIIFLLPQEKEFCFKSKIKSYRGAPEFSVDCSKLYLSERFGKKGWEMFLSRPADRVFILTGSAVIKTFFLCGNVTVFCKEAAVGSFYVSVPYMCTSIGGFRPETPCPSARITVKRTYPSKDGFSAYIAGKITIEENKKRNGEHYEKDAFRDKPERG